jgi:hypothetical protein
MKALNLTAVAVAAAALLLPAPLWAAASVADLEARAERLGSELEELRAQIAGLKAAQDAAAPEARTHQAAAAAESRAAPTGGASAAMASAASPALDWFGYGELNYTKPRGEPATADLARFVLGASYRFDERTRLLSELEIEHAVSSAEDAGEVEIEQAYLERSFGAHLYGRAGLMLIPLGLLNENHEPTRYFGVQRNNVETAIIPTTWREGGIALQARTDAGWRWDLGVTTGFDLSKWDPTSSEGRESPLGAIHQELSLARAADLSGFLAVNYTGLPGLRAGAGVFGGGVSQSQPGYDAASLLLWEAHLAWTPGDWDLAALYARGHLSGTGPVNLRQVGLPTPIPEGFWGGYLQAAYRGLPFDAGRLLPFVRYERYNTAAAYAFVAPGLTPARQRDTAAWTGGVNYLLTGGVVLKADYLNFNSAGGPDRFDLGVGYQF